MNNQAKVLQKLSALFEISQAVKVGNDMPVDVSYMSDAAPKTMTDARSAAFYCMGVAQKTGKTAALILDGRYLSNCYTAIIEAWFQKVNLLIIPFFSDFRDLKLSWLDKYLSGMVILEEAEIEIKKEEIRNLCRLTGPKLVGLFQKGEMEVTEDSDLALLIQKIKQSNITVSLYNNQGKTHLNVDRFIPQRYVYGVISEYIGRCVVGDEGVLVCTPEVIEIDLNIFRTRYKNSLMRIIVFDPHNTLNAKGILSWVESNGWHCKQAFTEEIPNFSPEIMERPSLIVFRKGEKNV